MKNIKQGVCEYCGKTRLVNSESICYPCFVEDFNIAWEEGAITIDDIPKKLRKHFGVDKTIARGKKYNTKQTMRGKR